MKKIALGLLLAVSVSTASAHSPHRHSHHHGSHWIGPAIGGLIVGAAISSAYARPPLPVPVTPPVYAVPQSQPEYYNCLVQVLDPYTNTYRNEVRVCVR